MTTSWESETPPTEVKITPLGWLRAFLRAVPLVILVFGGLLILILTRLVEQPIHGLHRPYTPHITQFVCRWSLRILGIRHRVTGAPMEGRGAVVANHSSWLDIFALNVAKRIYFVSKSEVARWPGIGWLAKATGTVFIERNPARAREQTALFQQRLLAGHKLLFFPEGTSTDGLRVLPFKTTLFQSFYAPELRDMIAVQPVTVVYHAPPGKETRFFGWWGDMDFGSHCLATLAEGSGGQVDVIYHAPLAVADFPNRKALAKTCEDIVRKGHTEALPELQSM
ncbi:lysophospholipid acyltransferase family protein [Marimonas sp. MJW-29]|uniref:Lysophospholipid acyltransferase family protein n=1 Tax=Sulfitobacter sediminis TaxID=3234186 RepID=A0ABV3RS27_9RHOB